MKQDPNENSLLKLNEKHAQFCRGGNKKDENRILDMETKRKKHIEKYNK
jgi:hypothetical protein